MKRYDFLKAVADQFADQLVVVSIGRGVQSEWNSLRPSGGNFFMNCMGLASSVGLGFALALPSRKVVIFQGDGDLLMNLGSLATEVATNPPNLVHVVFDNGCYEACGGGDTATALGADLAGAAKGIGIKNSFTVTEPEDFRKHIIQALPGNELYFIVAKTEVGSADLPMLPLDGIENKHQFAKYIEETEQISARQGLPSRRKV